MILTCLHEHIPTSLNIIHSIENLKCYIGTSATLYPVGNKSVEKKRYFQHS